MFAKLDIVHMSGDEAESVEGRRSGTYIIIEAAWQSEEMKLFLRALDERYFLDWADAHKQGGRGPRKRIAKPDGRVVNSEAPVGLWINCYDPAWLRKQPPWVVRELYIINQPYKFDLQFTAQTSMEEVENIRSRLMGGVQDTAE